MGLFRCLLAILVVISHVGITIYGYNPGIVAVISFFLLSGYVTTILISKHYKQVGEIHIFYFDRVLRLFPQFLFYMIIASIVIVTLKIDSPSVKSLTLSKWILNFFMLPQGFYMFWAKGALVIPQTWSLGLEMTFYIVIPWIVVCLKRNQIYTLAGMSFLVFLAAYTGIINTDNYGYRLLPGTLFIFLSGSFLSKKDRGSKIFVRVVFISALFLFALTFVYKSIYWKHYNKEVLLGLLGGLTALIVLKKFRFSNIDNFFGNLSYGIFLNHFIIIWVMKSLFFIEEFKILHIMVLLFFSIALAFVSFSLIERPVLKMRHVIRNRHKIYA